MNSNIVIDLVVYVFTLLSALGALCVFAQIGESAEYVAELSDCGTLISYIFTGAAIATLSIVLSYTGYSLIPIFVNIIVYGISLAIGVFKVLYLSIVELKGWIEYDLLWARSMRKQRREMMRKVSSGEMSEWFFWAKLDEMYHKTSEVYRNTREIEENPTIKRWKSLQFMNEEY